MPVSRPIGGFFGLEPADAAAASPAGFEFPHRLLFWNARAALAHLLSALSIRRVWLPAYVCAEPAQAAARDGREVRFYPVGGGLSPDPDVLAKLLRPGDAVLGVDYFGARVPGLPELAPRFPDVVWIQDRAQALWPDAQPWGDHLLYSPRKVLGAPDGGVLVSRTPLPAPDWAEPPDPRLAEPARMRAEDPQGVDNDAWFPLYRAAEAAMSCELRPMSAAARAVVEAADTAALAGRRRRNAELLYAQVGEAALLPAGRLLPAAPLGVPVLTEDAGVTSARMAAARIFCARHWAELPSPPDQFPAEHALSRRLLTLPCDHRYGDEDMARVAAAFRACR